MADDEEVLTLTTPRALRRGRADRHTDRYADATPGCRWRPQPRLLAHAHASGPPARLPLLLKLLLKPFTPSRQPIDLKPKIEAKCQTGHCKAVFSEYLQCKERVKADTTGEKQCTPQYLEFLHCVDHCAAKDIFASLK